MEAVLINFIIFGTIALIVWKYFESKTKIRMNILEKGLNPEEYAKLFKEQSPFKFNINPLRNLQVALITIFTGIGVLFASIIDRWYNLRHEFTVSIIMILGGLGLLIFYFIASKKIKVS
jgi:hypothetical protein